MASISKRQDCAVGDKLAERLLFRVSKEAILAYRVVNFEQKYDVSKNSHNSPEYII